MTPIRVDRENEVPVREQLRQQIIFAIATGEYPVGYEMPSVRELELRHRINRNTISQVYTELAQKRWLVRKHGKKMVVVHPRGNLPDPATDDIETLLVRLMLAARTQNVPAEQIVSRVRELATSPRPDHFLIVEPERGIGEVLRYEVAKATNRRVDAYSLPQLREQPELMNGAALLVPAYLADMLDFISVQQRAEMTLLTYAPFGGFVEQVRKLADPSVIGMFSVSGPGMKTMDGVFAESIGSRHQLVPFFLEWPLRDGKAVIRKLDREDLPRDIDIRLLGKAPVTPENSGRGPAQWAARLPVAVERDLRTVDLLFTDSIANNFAKHPRQAVYRLLSDASLREIAKVKLREAN